MKNTIIKILFKYPKIKKIVKNIYQFAGFILSNKKTKPKNIIQISDSNYDHLFGYYDKSPWSNDGRKIIFQRVYDAHNITSSTKKSEIYIFDLVNKTKQEISDTHSWNVQQGSMLQWLGPDFNSKIIYNDFIDGHYCSVILDIYSGNRTFISSPIYSVSKTGKFALSLDFSRLNSLRPGYGYCNLDDLTRNIKIPIGTAIWRIDLDTNIISPLISYNQLINLSYKNTMGNSFHKVNHIMISPESNNFIFLHRWLLNGRKYDRLIVSDIDGRKMEVLLDDDMVSHYNWLDNHTIIVWANTHDKGNHYYIIDIISKEVKIFMQHQLKSDGHPSISPDKNYIITDTYPNFFRKQKIYLCQIKSNKCIEISSIYSNYKYRNNSRCDLHPRWNPNSDQICFDGSQNKKRQVYIMNIKEYLTHV